jgi:predicted ATP-dependent endonuclease of OLD family
MYNLYLNSERSRLFLSNKVIICEGISDKVLIDYFIRLKGENYISEIYVLETNGKYDMVRYMKLLDYFGIKYGIVYDTDSDKSIDESLAKNLNKYIEQYIKNNNNSTYFDKLLFAPNLEEENGFFIKKNDDLKGVNKPLYILKKIEENELPNFQGTKVKIEDFIEKLHKF